MPAPGSITYDDAVKVDAHTALRDFIDGDGSAGTLTLYTEADATLIQYNLSYPCGSVNGTTGQLTITAPASANATGTGTCTWARIADNSGDRAFDIPVQEGSVAVSGYLVMNTADIISGAPVEVLSILIG